MLNTLLSRKEYWIRCFSVAQQSAASLRAILYSQQWASFLYEYRWEAGPVYPITLRLVTSLFVTLSSQTRRGIHDSRWLDFWCYEDREMRQKKKSSVNGKSQHQNSDFSKCWLDKPLHPSENVQVIKSVQFFLHQSGVSPPLSDLINVDTEFLPGNHQFYFRDWDPVRTDSGIVCVLTFLLAIKWVSDDNTLFHPGEARAPIRHNVTWRIRCNGIHNETRFS